MPGGKYNLSSMSASVTFPGWTYPKHLPGMPLLNDQEEAWKPNGEMIWLTYHFTQMSGQFPYVYIYLYTVWCALI